MTTIIGPPNEELRWWGILLIVLGCVILLLVIIILIILIIRCHRWGRVWYDEETGTTTRQRKSNSQKKVIQTQTSPARKRHETPPSTMLSQESRQPPAVFVTDATPMTSPRERTPTPGSLPGAVIDDDDWASPYPEPTPSVSGPRTSHKKMVTVERVSVTESKRAVTPSGVNVAGSQLKDSTSPRHKSRPKKDISEMLPDVDDSKNTSPGKKYSSRKQ